MRASAQTDLGLLVLRIGAGVMMMAHGWGKVMMLVDGNAAQFPDILGVGSMPALLLATFAEFLCSLLVVLGLWTRWAAVPVVITMATAFFVAHAADPFRVKELALLYLVAFATLIFTGGGRYALDAKIGRRRR